MTTRSTIHRVRTIGVALSVVFALGATACSSDSKSSSTTSTTAGASSDATTAGSTTADSTAATSGAAASGDSVAAVTARVVSEAEKVGYTLDEACVAKLVATLPPADLELLAEAAADTTPGATTPPLSDAGDAIGNSILTCSKGSTNQDLINQAADVVLNQGGNSSLDRECVTKQLATLNDEQLQLLIDSGPESTDQRLSAAAFALLDCFGLTDTTAAGS